MRRHCGHLVRYLFVIAVGIPLYSGVILEAWAGPFEEGIAAYNRGDYETALAIWRPLATDGDARAQYRVASLYGAGQGVRRNDAKVVSWMHLAAEQGVALAQSRLGFMDEYGERVAPNERKALEWYRKAARQGDEFARDRLTYIARFSDPLAYK